MIKGCRHNGRLDQPITAKISANHEKLMPVLMKPVRECAVITGEPTASSSLSHALSNGCRRNDRLDQSITAELSGNVEKLMPGPDETRARVRCHHWGTHHLYIFQRTQRKIHGVGIAGRATGTGTQGKPPLQQTNDDLDNCAISTIVRGWEALERSAGKDAAPIALFEHHHR